MYEKILITTLVFTMMLLLAFNVSAAEFEAGKHADSAVVNIKGQVDPDDIVEGKVVTVAIVEDLGLETQRVVHVTELGVNEAGLYGFEESFTPVVAYYGENYKLLGTKIFDEETINFYNKTKVVQTEIIRSNRSKRFNS